MTVLVVCLSEAAPALVDQWMASGDLPNLARLRAEGIHGTTAHGPPTLLTPQMWASIATGRSPGHHGVFDYWQRRPDGRFRETHFTDLEQPTLWQIVAESGRRCGVVNVPLTYPPLRRDGLTVIAGQDAPGSRRSIAQPRRAYEDVVERFGRYGFKDAFPGGQDKAEYARQLQHVTEHLGQVFDHLLTREPWDLFLCYFPSAAMAQHYFWSDMERGPGGHGDVMRTTYRLIDAAIGRLRDRLGDDDTVLVISECGAGPISSGVQVNTLLEQEGFLTKSTSRSHGMMHPLARRTLAGARGAAQRSLSDSTYYWANASPVKGWLQQFLATSQISWGYTRMYFRGKGEGNLYVNLLGREPHGIVTSGREYEDLRSEAVERLTHLVDERTGEVAITAVHRREDLYDGPHLEAAPDLIVEWRDFAYMPTESDVDADSVFTDRWREYMTWPTSGSHRMAGLLLGDGPGIGSGDVGEVALVDIAPTLLALLGIDAPNRLEGRVIGPVR